jgi:hypothetical protein
MYNGISEAENFPASTSARVTAGLRWAPLIGAAISTPVKTPMAHPKEITIHPLLFPLVFARHTLATTPLPKQMIIAVPKNSAKN